MLAQPWYDNGGLDRWAIVLGFLVLVLAIVGAIKLVEAVRHRRPRGRDGPPEQDPPQGGKC
ncbi:MAG: hypothetical protein ABI345_01545 [Jatrophihabitans sp.]